MRSLHDPAYRSRLTDRLRGLQPDSERRWGSMTIDQMLWHVGDALAMTAGEITLPREKIPIPRGLLKFIVLHFPWGKGAPTHSQLVAKRTYDFEAERARCLRLIDKVASTDINGAWPDHPAFGSLTGSQASRLQAKHVDHHLRQFGA